MYYLCTRKIAKRVQTDLPVRAGKSMCDGELSNIIINNLI